VRAIFVSDRTTLEGVDVDGPADAQAIVFVHGAMFTREMWLPQRRALADEFRVAALNLPGHGTFADETFRMEPAIDRLENVIDTAASGSAVLVGLSLGGYVATEYASRNPQDVNGLILTGSSANPVRGMRLVTRANGTLAHLLTRPDIGKRAVERLATRWVRNRDLPQGVEAEIIAAGFCPKQFGDAGPDVRGVNFRKKLSTYPGPTLIINGEHDKIMRRGEREHAAAAQDARIEVLAGVGHICNLHRPETYTDRVRNFVRRDVASRQ
jgi:pimeloyl-ACP methyl ester carboxylesterase